MKPILFITVLLAVAGCQAGPPTLPPDTVLIITDTRADYMGNAFIDSILAEGKVLRFELPSQSDSSEIVVTISKK